MQTGVRKLPPTHPYSHQLPLFSPSPQSSALRGKNTKVSGESGGGGGRAARGNLEHAGASTLIASVSSPPLPFLKALFYVEGSRGLRYSFISQRGDFGVWEWEKGIHS